MESQKMWLQATLELLSQNWQIMRNMIQLQEHHQVKVF